MKKGKCMYSVASSFHREDYDGQDWRSYTGIVECDGRWSKKVDFDDDGEKAHKWLIRNMRSQLTSKQKEALKKVIQRRGRQPDDERDYGEYYGVVYDKLFIGIEEDGYTHT